MLNTSASTSLECFKLQCQCECEWALDSENSIRLSAAATAVHSLRSQQLFKVPPPCCRPVFSAPLSPATALMIERDVHVIPWGNSIFPHVFSQVMSYGCVFVSEGAFTAFGSEQSLFDVRVWSFWLVWKWIFKCGGWMNELQPSERQYGSPLGVD